MSGHDIPPGDPGGTLDYVQKINEIITRSPSTQEAVRSLMTLSQLNQIPSLLNREFLSQLECDDTLKGEINEIVDRGFWISDKGDRIDINEKMVIHSDVTLIPQKMEVKQTNDNKKHDLEILLYTIYDTGPFVVNIESNNNSELHYQKIGRLFSQSNNKNFEINRVMKKGKNRVAIFFKTLDKANEFIKNTDFLATYNLRAFIPRHLVTTKALIRGIDPEFSEEDIRNNLKSLGKISKITNVRRIKKKSKEDSGLLINTPLVVVTFRGKFIPQKVELFLCVFPTEKYIDPVIQCFGCLRYGHTISQCKSKHRCDRCGEGKNENEKHDNCHLKCIFCNEAHSSSEKGTAFKNRICKEFIRQKKIKEIMSIYNLSFFEASKKIKEVTPQTKTLKETEAIRNIYTEDFPPLTEEIPEEDFPLRKNLTFTKILNKTPRTQLKRPSQFNEDSYCNTNGRIQETPIKIKIMSTGADAYNPSSASSPIISHRDKFIELFIHFVKNFPETIADLINTHFPQGITQIESKLNKNQNE
ncbi:unnamed protein product [Brassicogethes aeneus]|uniref:Uncharacterized protein n=1 Tax=Brassicogethes aeneus TaxID=1431903 RepID=A0A9P0B0G0_BRAAE|nr:unnamed protein product [Brassicogethes aeneus]